jgi:hypothetical protein
MERRSSSLVNLNRVLLKTNSITSPDASATHNSNNDPSANIGNKECYKCKEMVRSQLLDTITSENALVCKHNSTQNISLGNPGLLIVERETAVEAQNAALGPHLLASHIHNPGSMSHARAKELKFNQNCDDSKQQRQQHKSGKQSKSRQKSSVRNSVHDAYCAGGVGGSSASCRPLSSSREFVNPMRRPLNRHSQLASAERLKNYQHFQAATATSATDTNNPTSNNNNNKNNTEVEYDYDTHYSRQQSQHQQQHNHDDDENENEEDGDGEGELEEQDYKYEEFYVATSSHDVREIPISSHRESSQPQQTPQKQKQGSNNGDNAATSSGINSKKALQQQQQQQQYEEQMTYDKFYSKSNIVNRGGGGGWSNRKT